MDFQTITRIVDELSRLLTGARVERVFGGAGGELCLALGRDRKQYLLLLSPDRQMPRLHLVRDKPAAAPTPRGFILYLRSHIPGGRISRIAVLHQDRLVELAVSRQGRELRIVFELTGAASNLVVIDASSNILAVYYPVPVSGARRALLPGLRYELPSRKPGDPIGPASGEPQQGDSPNRDAELFYSRLIEQGRFDRLRALLRSRIRKALLRTGRKSDALARDLEGAFRSDEYRRAGDLILANLAVLRTGMEQAELRDGEGRLVTLRLDPRRSPAVNAEGYFKKYKKAKAGKAIMTARRQRAGEERERLQAALARVDAAEDLAALGLVHAELAAEGSLPPEPKKPGEKDRRARPDPFRTLVYRGWEILVGRTAAGNDYLTTKVAKDRDLWLHAESLPGSHVVIRNPDSGEIPPAVIARAASLAAFYSKGKNAGKVPVAYTPARFVRKPKGAKPGLVTLAERKTIMAVPRDGGDDVSR